MNGVVGAEGIGGFAGVQWMERVAKRCEAETAKAPGVQAWQDDQANQHKQAAYLLMQ